MNDVVKISRKKALEIIRLHRLCAVEEGRCEQCQYPFYDGLCECEPNKHDEDWDKRCEQIVKLDAHFKFSRKELMFPEGFWHWLKGIFFSEIE